MARSTKKDLEQLIDQLDADEQEQVLNLARALADGEGTEKSLTDASNPGVYSASDARESESKVPSYKEYVKDDNPGYYL